jgi:ProP effector
MKNESKKELLRTSYADLLGKYEILRDKKPLAIGIYDEVLVVISEPKLTSYILAKHTRNSRYLKSLAEGGKRFHLDGTEADDILEIHKSHALTSILERSIKLDKKKAVQVALKEAKAIKKMKVAAPVVTEKKPALPELKTPKITIKKRRSP